MCRWGDCDASLGSEWQLDRHVSCSGHLRNGLVEKVTSAFDTVDCIQC